jgi:hypothetical protein
MACIYDKKDLIRSRACSQLGKRSWLVGVVQGWIECVPHDQTQLTVFGDDTVATPDHYQWMTAQAAIRQGVSQLSRELTQWFVDYNFRH